MPVYIPIDKELLTPPQKIVIDDKPKYIDLVVYLVDALGIIEECRLQLNQIKAITNNPD